MTISNALIKVAGLILYRSAACSTLILSIFLYPQQEVERPNFRKVLDDLGYLDRISPIFVFKDR